MNRHPDIFVFVGGDDAVCFPPEAVREWLASLENRIDLVRFDLGLSREIESLLTRLEGS